MRHFYIFLIVFSFAITNASAQGLVKAPVNPDFLKISDKKIGIQSITSSGHSLGYKPSIHDLSHLKTPPAFRVQSYDDFYDLRSLGKLTSIKDQDPYGSGCGACWTFAAFGSMESVLLPGETWNFSENNMKNTHGFDWGHCDGGNQDMSIAYLSRWDGPKLDSEDPYDEGDPVSPSGLTTQKHLQEALYIPARTGSLDNDAIKQALLDYGAIDTSMYWDDPEYNAANKAYYYDGALRDADHGVVIVGWNDNYPAANFSPTPPGNGAFIIRNSWGSSWGENGYFYISYYDANIARNTNVVYSVIQSTANYSKVYEYDPLGWVESFGYTDPVAYMANIFTADYNDTLSAVSFYTNDVNTAYEVKVYGNVTGDPDNGSPLTTVSDSFSSAGYHTVTIPPTSVTSGQKFSVVVKLTNSSYGYPVAIEDIYPGYSSNASANPGESYVSSNGSDWEDITTVYGADYNVCIKAFVQADATAPSDVTTVNDGASIGTDITYVNSATELSANWSAATDAQSGIAKYWYAIGTSAGATNIVSWTDNALNLSVTKTGLGLINGQIYYFTVKAENGAGFKSSVVNSNGQTVDITAPNIITTVNDGTGADITYVNSLTSLSANWSQTTDNESGIAKYWYAIGTTPGANDEVDWTDNGLNLSVTKTGLSLADGQIYYFTVKAENNIALQSTAKNSNGQKVDITSPTAKIEISSLLPIKSGTLEFKLIINEANEISGNPVLSFKGSDGIERTCALEYLISSTWTGTAFIESYISTGTAIFSFGAGDVAGNTGSVITAGSSFAIDTAFNGASAATIVNSDGTSIIFPAGGYAGTLIVNISTPAPSSLTTAESNTHNSFVLSSNNLAKEFTAHDMSYNPITNFSELLTLKIYYPDADNNGRLDGDNVLENALGLYYLDEALEKWILVNNMVSNFIFNYIQAETNHFSIYSIRYIGSAQSALSQIKAYPNPCHMPNSNSGLTFENIPVQASNVKIYIYNVAGNLIRVLDRNDGINSLNIAVWNGRNKSGKKAASGLYIYMIKTAAHGSSSGKFVISW